MDHLELSIDLPDCDVSTNAVLEWATLKQHTHVQQSSDNRYMDGLEKAFLLNIAGVQAQEVFNMFGLSYEDVLRFSQILQRLEDVCIPRFLVVYSRYKFATCKQGDGKLSDFIQELKYWCNNCEYGHMKDDIFKNAILKGISDETMQLYTFKDRELNLKHALDICEKNENKKDMKNAQTGTDQVICVDTCVGTQEADVPAVNVYDELTKNCQIFKKLASKDSHNLVKQRKLNSVNSKTSLRLDFLEAPKISEELMKKESLVTEETNLMSSKNYQDEEIPMSLRQPSRSSHSSIVLEVSKTDNKPKSIVGTESKKEITNKRSKSVEKEKMFECNKCEEHFSESSFITHVRHPCDNNLSCQKCSSYKHDFKDGVCLKSQRQTNVKKYICDVCKSSFRNPSHLKVHLRLHTGERPFTCDTCGASFPEASKLKSHIRKHTGEQPYACEVCHRKFTWTAAYKRHMRTHTGEKPYTCEFCGGSFADFTSFQRHRRIHTKEKPYKCEICESKFTDPSALKLHMRSHTGERPYTCPECSSSFVRSQHLKEHMKLHTGEKPFECRTCGAKFNEASKLKIHLRKHTGEKPYQCKICGSSFAWTASFTRHMRTHTMEKPYICHTCDSRFADHSTLTRHNRTHTKERPYVCRVCQTNFADISSLHRHTRIHTGEKSYVCEVCGASFVVKSYLIRHIRTHTGEKPYICPTCGAKFTDSSKLNRHKKIHMPKPSLEHQNTPSKQQEQVLAGEQLQYEQLQPLQLSDQQQSDEVQHLMGEHQINAIQGSDEQSLSFVEGMHPSLFIQSSLMPFTHVAL